MDDLAVRADRSPTRCPFCRDDLLPGKELVACAACGARHHATCHRDHGRCASCGSAEALVPRARPRRREQPLAGSKIRVEADEAATAYLWPGVWRWDVPLAVLFSLTGLLLPLGLWLFYLRAVAPREERLTLAPDAIRFQALRVGGLSYRALTARREDVGVVRVERIGNMPVLSIDVGVTRHRLWTGDWLAAPELEWLAERIIAWRDEA
jgi:hypothetical protein